MYNGFFGLKEAPFSIAPNPQYLFMSDRHKEALAHLMFGLAETGGFVLLTGEVGTGKTTTSRCLLEQVPENTQVAFILNPTLTEHELLATICDELKVTYPDQATIKQLTDTIRDHLLANHDAGKNTLLIIDEAQHLRVEVLEQLRLLTNLETNTKKLLQVILIGQPELQELLRRRELRQLAQRITARYHLLPLTESEVAAYVSHRLGVAGCQRAIFTKSAIRRLHKASAGIPRVINLICDRALMGAYGRNKSKVDGGIVDAAAKEALGVNLTHPDGGNNPWLSAPFLGAVGLMLVGVVSLGLWFSGIGQSSVNAQPSGSNNVQVAPPIKPAEPEAFLINQQTRSLPEAFRHLLKSWQVETHLSLADPCVDIEQWSLACYWMKGSLPSVITLDYPAILQFYDKQGQVFYGVLHQAKAGRYSIQLGNKLEQLDRNWLDQYWRGGAVIVWQKPDNWVSKIDVESDRAYLQWLENSLGHQLRTPPRVVTEFDGQLQRQLHKFQNSVGLPLTPYADEETLITLHHIVSGYGPSLNE